MCSSHFSFQELFFYIMSGALRRVDDVRFHWNREKQTSSQALKVTHNIKENHTTSLLPLTIHADAFSPFTLLISELAQEIKCVREIMLAWMLSVTVGS